MNDGIKPQMRTNKYYLCENMDRKNIEKSFYNYFRNDKKINETFDKTVIYIFRNMVPAQQKDGIQTLIHKYRAIFIFIFHTLWMKKKNQIFLLICFSIEPMIKLNRLRRFRRFNEAIWFQVCKYITYTNVLTIFQDESSVSFSVVFFYLKRVKLIRQLMLCHSQMVPFYRWSYDGHKTLKNGLYQF